MLSKPNPRFKPDLPPAPEKLKICVVGDKGVGKTQMLNAYCHGHFSPDYEQTIGSDFFTYTNKFGTGSGQKNV